MPSEAISSATFTSTADGDTTGYLTVASNVGMYPGSKAWLMKGDGTLHQYVLLTDLSGSTKIGLRFIAESVNDPKLQSGTVKPTLGRSDLTGYTTGSTLNVLAQVVDVIQPAFSAIPNIAR